MMLMVRMTTSKNVFLLYFQLKFHFYLELSSVSVGVKTCPWCICYECIQFQKEMGKIKCCDSRSPNNAEFGLFTYLLFFRKRQRNISRIIIYALSHCFALNLCFGELVFAIAVVFCIRSLLC